MIKLNKFNKIAFNSFWLNPFINIKSTQHPSESCLPTAREVNKTKKLDIRVNKPLKIDLILIGTKTPKTLKMGKNG